MQRLTVLAALAACPAFAQTDFPLEQGYYVAEGTPCAEASNATLQLVTRHDFNWPQQACTIAEVTKTGTADYTLAVDCEETPDFPAERLTLALTIPDPKRFGLSFSGEPPAFKQFCAQADLPDPWRSNDPSEWMD